MRPRILISDYPRVLDTVLGPTRLHTVTAWYPESVVRAGGLPLVLPVVPAVEVDDALDAADGVVLTGGGDIDPSRYGAPRAAETENVNVERDEYDLELARRAVERGLPLFAICRGLQVLNVALGGTLVQHVPAATGAEHSQLGHLASAVHRVRIAEGSRLASLLETNEVGVNSLHHQAVDRPAPGMRPVAWAEDGTIEALEPDAGDVLAVQWHPELMPDDAASQALFRSFVDAARRR